MHPIHPTCAALLLLAPLFAQAPTKTPTLHIPAGSWSVRDLLTHAEQALRTPIAVDGDELANASPEPVRLQFEQVLDPVHGHEAIAALLSTRGLLLATDKLGHYEVRAIPRGNPAWLIDRAVPSPVQELLDHPFRHAIVRCELPTRIDAPMLQEMLRVSAARGAATPACEAAKDGIVCTGTSAAVRFAITQVAALDPQFAATLQPRGLISVVSTAKGGPVELTAGEHRRADLVDLLARNCGINIVQPAAIDSKPAMVTIAKTQHLDWQYGSELLTNLLWQHHVLLLELDVRHGLYEVVVVDDPQQAPPVTRAAPRTVEGALDSANCTMYVVVQWQAKHLTVDKRMELVRTTLRGTDTYCGALLTVWCTTDGLLLSGLSPQVAALLQALQAADQPSRG